MNKTRKISLCLIASFAAMNISTASIAQESQVAPPALAYEQLMQEIAKGQAALEFARVSLNSMLSQIQQNGTVSDPANGDEQSILEDLIALRSNIDAQLGELNSSQNQARRVNSLLVNKQRESTIQNSQLEGLVDQRNRQKERLTQYRQTEQQVSERIGELDAQLRLENKKARELSGSIALMQDEIRSNQTALQEIPLSPENSMQDVSSRQQELAEARSKAALLSERNEQLGQTLALEQLKLKAAISEKNQQDAEAAKLGATLSELDTQATRYESEVQSKTESLQGLRNQVTQVQLSLRTKQTELSQLKSQAAELEQRNQFNSSNIVSADQELAQLKILLADLNSQLELNSDEAADLPEAIAATQREIDLTIIDSAEVTARKNQHLKEIAQLEQSLEGSRNGLDQARTELSTKKQQLKNEKARLDAVTAQAAALKSVQDGLQADLQTEPAMSGTGNEASQVVAELESVRAELKQQETLLATQQFAAAQAFESQKNLQKEVSQLEDENFTLWEQIRWTELQIEQRAETLSRERKKKQRSFEKLERSEQSLAKQQEVAARLLKRSDATLKEKAAIDKALLETQKAIDEAKIRTTETENTTKTILRESQNTRKAVAKSERALSEDRKNLRKKNQQRDVAELELKQAEAGH